MTLVLTFALHQGPDFEKGCRPKGPNGSSVFTLSQAKPTKAEKFKTFKMFGLGHGTGAGGHFLSSSTILSWTWSQEQEQSRFGRTNETESSLLPGF
jgi:hypothetical protein